MSNDRASYPCPLCNAAPFRPRYTIHGWNIVSCAACGMVYVNPRIRNEDIFSLYRNDYFHHGGEGGYENYELIAPLRTMTFRKWYDDFRRFLPAGGTRALDIGCAAGYFLEVLKEEGWQHIEGIELDIRMSTELRNRAFDIADVPLERFAPERRYHLITLFDVLEHLPEINNDFTKLSSMLDDNGIIALVTPDFSSFQRKLFGPRWFQFKPREHLYYFTPLTLRRLAEKHGFMVAHLSASGQFADFNFLHDRFVKYRFPLLDRLFSAACSLTGQKKKFWYIDTGSMFAVLKKKPSNCSGPCGKYLTASS